MNGTHPYRTVAMSETFSPNIFLATNQILRRVRDPTSDAKYPNTTGFRLIQRRKDVRYTRPGPR